MRRLPLIWATLASSVATLACGDPSPVAPPPDVMVDVPPSGCAIEICAPYACDERFDKCRTRCELDAHCVAGRICRGGACVGTACTEASGPAVCTPYVCVHGECALDCGASGCAQGFYCRGDTLRCAPRCATREDPLCEGFVCDVEVGECEPYCDPGELECAAGYTCTPDARCVRSE